MSDDIALTLTQEEREALTRLLGIWFRRERARTEAPKRRYDPPRLGWTCFHCGEVFHTRVEAAEHFGPTPDSEAACVAADQPVLRSLRHRLESRTA